MTNEQVYHAALLAIRNLLRSDPPDFLAAIACTQGAYHLANNALSNAHEPFDCKNHVAADCPTCKRVWAQAAENRGEST